MDKEERIGEKYNILSDMFNGDTYNFASYFRVGSGYEVYGDEEIRVRSIEASSVYHDDLDWANPGCQYGKNPYGPCP